MKSFKTQHIECREEGLADKTEYIDLIDTSVRAIIKEEVKTQLPQILPQAVLEFATLVIERSVTESLEAVVLAKYSSQLKSTYEADASLSENQDDKDKDQDPSAGSDRGTKRRKSSKDAESSRDPKSKESKSTSSSKGTSRSQHKSSGKSVHAEEPSHTIDDSGVQNNQEFDMGNNDEQPDDEAASKVDWFKKPKQPLTSDPDWNKRQHVDFKPSQTYISNIARAEKPPTSFDELMYTLINFSAFVMNRLNITNLTQELLVGPAFNLLKGTCKSRTELEYRRGHQVIPQDYFINNDLEYLKGGSLSRQYLTSVTKTKAATYEVKWIEDMVPNLWSLVKVVYDKHAYWGTSQWVTSLKIMKLYYYDHLDEIKVRREDQELYKFKEGDLSRLRLQDTEDMLLLLVQQKLTNLMIDERYDLNVALRMFIRRSVIQMRVEDLQLGDEIPAKEEMKWIRQAKGSCYDPGYRQAALSKKDNEESREVRWWKRIRRRPQTA
ncbi:hypothetical protein Tco_0982093 [Tanacetum coccineum]